MREDADSLVVSASSEKMSCLQVWELREKSLPVHNSLGKSETQQFFNTVVRLSKICANGKGQYTKYRVFQLKSTARLSRNNLNKVTRDCM